MVTTPSGGQVLLDQGFYNITGLAWSGRGKVKHVDVSVDGGRNWRRPGTTSPRDLANSVAWMRRA